MSRPLVQEIDYGWRLRGRPVTALQDRSLDLSSCRPSASFLSPYCRDVATVSSCLQCGACTATCGLSGDKTLLPRREITYVQLGMDRSLAESPRIWDCYDCGDCSSRCPSGVRPGRMMAGLRHLAIERFAMPSFFSRLLSSPRGLAVFFLSSSAILAGVIAATGSFFPGEPIVRYGAMLPHAPLNILFFSVLVAVLVSLSLSIRRAWRAFRRCGHRVREVRRLLVSLGKAFLEIAQHSKFSACEHRRSSAWAHRGAFYGFALLLVVSAGTAISFLCHGKYPFPLSHPLKLLGNLGAALLLVGSSLQIAARLWDATRGIRSSFFDWSFVVGLWLISATGVSLEVAREANFESIAYPLYFVHLELVLVFLASLPFGKLAHAAYRLAAVTAAHYDASLTETTPACQSPSTASRKCSTSEPPSSATVSAPDSFLRLDQKALASFSDATLTAAYYKLRDEAVPQGATRTYPNIRRLFGSPLEREKDRREIRALVSQPDRSDVQAWYERATTESCTWWIENHLVARHSLRSCMFCGMCTSVCPAAQYYEEYNPRFIVDVALSKDEDRLEQLLASDILWLCGQCGSCKARCTRDNNIMGLVSSLRCLAELKGFHLRSARGRQQYAARHLWGGNFWNRACSLYFRNPTPDQHPDFGPRHAEFYSDIDHIFEKLGACPDRDGAFGGRKVPQATLKELRRCVHLGGTLHLWNRLEEHAANHAASLGISIDEYLAKVSSEG